MGFWSWLNWLKDKRQEKEDAFKQTRAAKNAQKKEDDAKKSARDDEKQA